MTETVSLRSESPFRASFIGAPIFLRRIAREAVRRAAIGLGVLLVVAGFVIHPGMPLIVVGLILVLRNSRRARRRFVVLQRRHPRYLLPVRRLIRRDPNRGAGLWRRALKLERRLFPRRLRYAAGMRRRYLRAQRA